MSGRITSVISLVWAGVGSGHRVLAQEHVSVIRLHVMSYTKISCTSQLHVITSSCRILKSDHFLTAIIVTVSSLKQILARTHYIQSKLFSFNLNRNINVTGKEQKELTKKLTNDKISYYYNI